MYTDHNGVSYETQEDRFPGGFHSPDEKEPRKKKPQLWDKCPACGNGSFASQEPVFKTARLIELPIECKRCGHRWFEHYKLVETIDGPAEDGPEEDLK